MTEKLSFNEVATDYFPSHHNLVLLVLGGKSRKELSVNCSLLFTF